MTTIAESTRKHFLVTLVNGKDLVANVFHEKDTSSVDIVFGHGMTRYHYTYAYDSQLVEVPTPDGKGGESNAPVVMFHVFEATRRMYSHAAKEWASRTDLLLGDRRGYDPVKVTENPLPRLHSRVRYLDVVPGLSINAYEGLRGTVTGPLDWSKEVRDYGDRVLVRWDPDGAAVTWTKLSWLASAVTP